MTTLLLIVLIGLVISFFATQNTDPISLQFFIYQITEVPKYVVVVGAFLLGLFLSWSINLINNITTGFVMRKKDTKITDFKRENAELVKRVHQLELENAKLKERYNEPEDEKSL